MEGQLICLLVFVLVIGSLIMGCQDAVDEQRKRGQERTPYKMLHRDDLPER